MNLLRKTLLLAILLSLAGWGLHSLPAQAAYSLVCPTDTDGIDTDGDGIVDNDILCMHLAATDGFVNMGDGSPTYTFGFVLVDPITTPLEQIVDLYTLKANFPAPTIKVREGQQFYLTLSTLGFAIRPDLFDPHTVHWHGIPNQITYYDGEPMASFGVNMGSSFTYFYNVIESGTYMYHCHVEATEHMQMGMLGNLYATPKQDFNQDLKNLGTPPYKGFVFNDGDGSTGYHVDYPIQIHAFDPVFHNADLTIQPINFAALDDRYGMLNGRGYPDTINPNEIGQSTDNLNYASQKVPTLIQANAGERILLRISNLSFDYYTLTALGIPMKVVGRDAKILRGPTGKNLYYDTSSINLGGGESADVILDTTGVQPGRYFLYTTNLNFLTNNLQERGGMMTEIVIQ